MTYTKINDFIDCFDNKRTLIIDEKTYEIDCCSFNFTRNPCADDMAYIRIAVDDKFYDNIRSMTNDMSWKFDYLMSNHAKVSDVSINDGCLSMTIDYKHPGNNTHITMKFYQTEHY